MNDGFCVPLNVLGNLASTVLLEPIELEVVAFALRRLVSCLLSCAGKEKLKTRLNKTVISGLFTAALPPHCSAQRFRLYV